MLQEPVRRVAKEANAYFAINRLVARAGYRTLADRARHSPRVADWSLPYAGVVEMMTLGTPSGEIRSAADIRAPLDRVTRLSYPSRAARRRIEFLHLSGEWVTTPNTVADRVVLYLHGGGYVSGSPATHAAITTRLAYTAAARIFAPDYRLAPEHPFPAAVEDAWTTYWWLLTEHGLAPEQIVLAGDSAGGGLCIALLLALSLPFAAHAQEEKKEGDEKAAPKVMYVGIIPALVGNYSSGMKMKFYKADIALKVTGSEAEEKVKYHEPLIRNQLVQLFSQQTDETLGSMDAKEKLRQEALKQVQQVLEQEEGKPYVEDLLFNNLILQ